MQKVMNVTIEKKMTEPKIEEFQNQEKKQEAIGRHLMDFEYIHKELARPNVTLTLLHDEYVQEAHEGGKIPYAYRTFARHYRDYAMKYRSEEHTSELQSRGHLVCRLLLEKKKNTELKGDR